MSVILITGANKGLGLELVARLSRTQPDDTILLGTRSLANGDSALQKLKDLGVSTDKVKPFQIDVTSQQSVDAAVQAVKRDHGGKLKAVFNNAGVAFMNDDYESAKTLFGVNYYGVKRMIKAFDPLLVKGGHNVVVSSGMGAWATFSTPAALQQVLKEPQSEATVDKLVEQYLSALDPSNKESASLRQQYPDPAGFFGPYAMSKAFLNSYLRYIAPEEYRKSGTIITAVCPGYCATDLNNDSGPRKAATGAWSISLAAQVSDSGVGKFYRDGEVANYFERPQTMDEMTEEAKVLEARLYQEGVLQH